MWKGLSLWRPLALQGLTPEQGPGAGAHLPTALGTTNNILV